METIRAINSMASAEASGHDGTRTSGAVALRKRAPNIHIATNKSIILAQANGLNPAIDEATKIRLAAAVDRQLAGPRVEAQDPVALTRAVMADFLLQEAAARRLQLTGEHDPLDRHAAPETDRSALKAGSILQRNGVAASSAFSSASKEDLTAMASGRYDQIRADHTRFAVATMLNYEERQMAVKTQGVPNHSPEPRKPAREYPAAGVGIGPRRASALNFGRKVGAER